MTTRSIGIALIIAGLVALILPNINWTRQEKAAEIGPLKVYTEEKKTIDIPLYGGIAALIGGVVLVVASGKKP